MPTSYMERSMGQFADIAGSLGSAMAERRKKRLREELERELLGGDTLETYKLRDMMEDNELERRLREAQTAKALREPALRATPVRRGASGPQDAPEGDPVIRNGMIWNGRQWVKAPRVSTTATGDPERDALDKELRKKFGIDWQDMEDIMARGATPDEQDPNALSFKTKAGVDLTLDRGKLMPYVNRGLSIYRSGANKPEEPNADALTQQVQPKVTTPKVNSLTIPPDKGAEADAIRAAYKAGTITREEAKAKLAALSGR